MKISKIVLTPIAAVAVLALLLGSPTPVALGAQPAKLAVFPPDAEPYGLTYAEWSAEWWQWALSLPIPENPLFDESGCANGANGQEGPVWFLAGVINVSGIAVRDCTIPAGKAIFFPVLNTECSTVEAPPFYGSNEQELSECAKGFMDATKKLKLKVDGRAVGNLQQYRVQSPLFPFVLPENNVLGVPAGPGFSVSDGVFVMLEPLPPGEHTIEFGGMFSDYDFTLHITYNVTVVEPAP